VGGLVISINMGSDYEKVVNSKALNAAVFVRIEVELKPSFHYPS